MCVFKRTWLRKRNDVVRPRSAWQAPVVFASQSQASRDIDVDEQRARIGRLPIPEPPSFEVEPPARELSHHTAVPGLFERVRIGVRQCGARLIRPEGWCISRCPLTPGLPGTSGLLRGFRASLVRDVRGMKRGRRSFAPKPTTKVAICRNFYGSDGTRTRDLRRDRPVRAQPTRPAATGNWPPEQAFRGRANRL
jgi:hypothetical protein